MGNIISETLESAKEVRLMSRDYESVKNNLAGMIELLEGIATQISILSGEMSRVDKAIDDILHAIEQENFNAVDGYKIAKTIRGLRLERREIKVKMQVLENVYANTKDNHSKIMTNLRRAMEAMFSYEHYVGIDSRKVEISLND